MFRLTTLAKTHVVEPANRNLAIGVLFGWALVDALSDQGIDQFSVPIISLIVIVLLAGLAGIIAAIIPGRRAAKLDILRAVHADGVSLAGGPNDKSAHRRD